MPRRFTVEDWLNIILPTEEKIETVVRYGPDLVCRAESPSWFSSHGPPGVYEARVLSVAITKDRITIHDRPNDIPVRAKNGGYINDHDS